MNRINSEFYYDIYETIIDLSNSTDSLKLLYILGINVVDQKKLETKLRREEFQHILTRDKIMYYADTLLDVEKTSCVYCDVKWFNILNSKCEIPKGKVRKMSYIEISINKDMEFCSICHNIICRSCVNDNEHIPLSKKMGHCHGKHINGTPDVISGYVCHQCISSSQNVFKQCKSCNLIIYSNNILFRDICSKCAYGSLFNICTSDQCELEVDHQYLIDEGCPGTMGGEVTCLFVDW